MQSSPLGFTQLLLRRAEKNLPCGFYLYTWNAQRMSEKSITRTFPVHSSQCDALTGWHSALAAKCSDARYRFPTTWVSYTPHSEREAVYSDPGLLLSRHYHLATVFMRRVWETHLDEVRYFGLVHVAQIRSFSNLSSWCGSLPYNRAGGWGFPKRSNLTEEGGGKALIQRKVVILYLQPAEGGSTLLDFMEVWTPLHQISGHFVLKQCS